MRDKRTTISQWKLEAEFRNIVNFCYEEDDFFAKTSALVAMVMKGKNFDSGISDKSV